MCHLIGGWLEVGNKHHIWNPFDEERINELSHIHTFNEYEDTTFGFGAFIYSIFQIKKNY